MKSWGLHSFGAGFAETQAMMDCHSWCSAERDKVSFAAQPSLFLQEVPSFSLFSKTSPSSFYDVDALTNANSWTFNSFVSSRYSHFGFHFFEWEQSHIAGATLTWQELREMEENSIFTGWADRIHDRAAYVYDKYRFDIAEFLGLDEMGTVFSRLKDSESCFRKIKKHRRMLNAPDSLKGKKPRVEQLITEDDAEQVLNDLIGFTTTIPLLSTDVSRTFIRNLCHAIQNPRQDMRVEVSRIRPYRGKKISHVVSPRLLDEVSDVMERSTGHRPTILTGKKTIKESGYTSCQFDLKLKIYEPEIGEWLEVTLDLHFKEMAVYQLGMVEHFIHDLKEKHYVAPRNRTAQLLEAAEVYKSLTGEQRKVYEDYCNDAYTNVVKRSRRMDEGWDNVTVDDLRRMIGDFPDDVDPRLDLAYLYSLMPKDDHLHSDYFTPYGNIEASLLGSHNSGVSLQGRLSDWQVGYSKPSVLIRLENSVALLWYILQEEPLEGHLDTKPNRDLVDLILALKPNVKEKLMRYISDVEMALPFEDYEDMSDESFYKLLPKFPKDLDPRFNVLRIHQRMPSREIDFNPEEDMSDDVFDFGDNEDGETLLY